MWQQPGPSGLRLRTIDAGMDSSRRDARQTRQLNVTYGKAVVGALLGGVLCLVLATRVFVGFDAALRVKVVRNAMPVTTGSSQVSATEPANQPPPPFAVIARIRNDSSVPEVFSIRADGQAMCTATVSSNVTRRVDCAAVRWPHEIEIAPSHIGTTSWVLEYLEVATHYGQSTGFARALVLPARSTNYRGPSAAWVCAVWAILTALFLCPSLPIPFRAIRSAYLFAIVAAIGLLGAVLIAPIISRYRVVLSVGNFAGWVSILVLPRLLWLGRKLWTVCCTGGWRVAWFPAMTVVLVGLMYGQRAAGGSDVYGYVSEADLWLRGDLKIDQSFVAAMPWPDAPRWFAPLAYQPRAGNDHSIVPVYSPGLPLMMAAAKLMAGQTAMFCVAPLCGGLLVLATYGIGRRLGSGIAAPVAGWLVATSPVVLMQSVMSMSDVPVAAAWAGAFYLLLGSGAGSAAGAGLLSAVAILIRPNLAPLAVILGLHYLFRMRRADTRRRALGHLCLFGAGVLPGVLAIAVINQYLYGSPLTSGYGNVGALFDARRMSVNARNYLRWFADAHTPIALIGFAALAVPLRRLWPAVRERAIFWIIGAFVLSLWAIYCAWLVFDSWLFSRFLLPSWPFIMLGVGACADALFRMQRRSWTRPAVILAVTGLVVAQLQFARNQFVFEIAHSDGRYAVAGRLTKEATDANSVVLSLHHSGSIRYYGERMTMNFTLMDAGSLDQVVDWLGRRGIRTYATLEDWEIPEFRQHFAGARRLAALAGPPRAALYDPGAVFVFELSEREGAVPEPLVVKGLDIGWRAIPPGPPPSLVLGPERH